MNKELFIKCLQALKDVELKEDKIGKLLISKDSTGWIDLVPELKNALIDVLKESTNDIYDYIDEWLYAVGEDRRVWEEFDETHDIEYDLSDPEDLWYYLNKEYGNVSRKIVTHVDAKPMTFVDWSMIKKMWDF